MRSQGVIGRCDGCGADPCMYVYPWEYGPEWYCEGCRDDAEDALRSSDPADFGGGEECYYFE